MTEPEVRPSRTWWIVAASLGAAWVLYLAFFGPGGPRSGALPPPQLAAPSPAATADYRWVLRDLDDRPVEFASYKGRPVFLNIWATWCGPCVAELPSIVNLAKDPALKDVAFLCVSTDDSPATVKSFLRGKSWPMTILRADDLPAVFTTPGIPATFLIAPDGSIAASDVGAAQWDDPSVVEFLERLAKPPPGAIAGADAVRP